MFYSESDSTSSTQPDTGLSEHTRLKQRVKPKANTAYSVGDTLQNAQTQTHRQSVNIKVPDDSALVTMSTQSIHVTSNVARGITIKTGGPLQQVYQVRSVLDCNDGDHKFDWMTRGGNKGFRFSTGLQQYDNIAFTSDDPIYASVYSIPSQDKTRNNRSVPIKISETAKLARHSTMQASELHLESEPHSETASRDLPVIPEGSTHQFSEDEGYSEGVWVTVENNYQEQIHFDNMRHHGELNRAKESGKKNAKKLKKGATCNSSSSVAAILPEDSSEVVSVRGRDENDECCFIL